jgi:hypothetical protein
MISKACLLFSICFGILPAYSQSPSSPKHRFKKVIQLTHNPCGHTIHNTQCFSPDDRWIIYDTRNVDTMIGSNGSIQMVNTKSGEISELYHTENQTEYGPGVGAATFSPVRNRVLFIHGIRNSDKNNPYGFTRRTGVAIDISKPGQPIFMDARDITPSFTAGALRGGTHAHTWSGDGQWISFTYNDFVINEREKKEPSVKDLRTVGVMVPEKAVSVPEDPTHENNSGKMFSVVVANVTDNPKPGSDEIDKAFDEGWIGKNGYRQQNGKWQKRAIAFQGEITNIDRTKRTEVFVLDLPEDVTKATPGKPLEGTSSSRPNVPEGVSQRRITHLDKGIQGPRHWLRSSPDGSLIAFLAEDDKGIVQIFGVSPNGEKITALTSNPYPIQGPFNFSPDGKQVSYMADNSVFITEIKTGISQRLTPHFPAEEKISGAVVWSNNGKMLAFNKYAEDKKTGKMFLQIFMIVPGD